jgi:hypothetical protein
MKMLPSALSGIEPGAWVKSGVTMASTIVPQIS